VNKITSLEDDHGNKISDSQGMSLIAKHYFLDLFQKQNSATVPVIIVFRRSVYHEDNILLTTPFTKDEF
jgi:hypothetical protein